MMLFRVLAIALAACSASQPSQPSGDPPDGGGPPDAATGLPVRHVADPAAAARGQQLLESSVLGGELVPALAMRNLWLVWGTGQPASDAAYWTAFEARYGFFAAPFPNAGLPLGIRQVGSSVTLDCLACHANRIAGAVAIGAGNARLDLQGLYDDLTALDAKAPEYGYPSYPIPFTLENRTGAAGANDAFGLGMTLAGAGQHQLHTAYGFQEPPAWWTLAYKDRHYTDGSGESGGYRTMMATLLASGMTLGELQAKDAEFADLWQFLLSLQPPHWSGSIDAGAAGRGETTFDAHCAGCHGTYHGHAAGYESPVIAVDEVGTDPTRATAFGAAEAAFVDASWFGADHPMTATNGYLAPPLVGVWATAPYFHNGSVPTLAAVLDSSLRPSQWQRDGEAYDVDRVGIAVVAATPSGSGIARRMVYDTTQPGLSAGGHTFGDALAPAERSDLLEYLKTL